MTRDELLKIAKNSKRRTNFNIEIDLDVAKDIIEDIHLANSTRDGVVRLLAYKNAYMLNFDNNDTIPDNYICQYIYYLSEALKTKWKSGTPNDDIFELSYDLTERIFNHMTMRDDVVLFSLYYDAFRYPYFHISRDFVNKKLREAPDSNISKTIKKFLAYLASTHTDTKIQEYILSLSDLPFLHIIDHTIAFSRAFQFYNFDIINRMKDLLDKRDFHRRFLCLFSYAIGIINNTNYFNKNIEFFISKSLLEMLYDYDKTIISYHLRGAKVIRAILKNGNSIEMALHVAGISENIDVLCSSTDIVDDDFIKKIVNDPNNNIVVDGALLNIISKKRPALFPDFCKKYIVNYFNKSVEKLPKSIKSLVDGGMIDISHSFTIDDDAVELYLSIENLKK